jgi:hypothetical protein
MHNPVTDGSNIFFTVYDAISIISENTGNNADGFNGVRNENFFAEVASFEVFIVQAGAGKAYSSNNAATNFLR